MKAIGIIRNVDNLGRIVIPIELRKAMNISEGDHIEIFTEDDGRIILRKYQINGAVAESIDALRNTIEAYGGKLPGSVAGALKKHCQDMKELVER